MKPLKIVADENMPGVVEWFAPFGEVTLLPGRTIGAVDIKDADVLLVRSVTRVDQSLLAGSAIKFVGSATIGVDHVDTGYLANQEIRFAHAPGCNARAVVEYVLSCCAALQPDWMAKTFAIIGCGNVGGLLLSTLQGLGVNVLTYDPFLDPTADHRVSLEQALASDIICLHTPLTRHGQFPTYHLLNADKLALINHDALLINAGRGSVIDQQALLFALAQQRFRCVLDVWENEPHIEQDLLHAVELGTPHIAGYSKDGKVKGTHMIYQAFRHWLEGEPTGPDTGISPGDMLGEEFELKVNSVNDAILQAYDVRRDDRMLRSAPDRFDLLRKNYPHRLEFSHFRIAGEMPEQERLILQRAGFRV